MHLYNILDKRGGQAPTAAATAAALEANRLAAEAANELGDKCYHKKEYQEAIQHYSSAIGLDGTNHEYYFNRSVTYQLTDSWTYAAADARKVSITSNIFVLISHVLAVILDNIYSFILFLFLSIVNVITASLQCS